MQTTLLVFGLLGGAEVSGAGTWWTIVGFLVTANAAQFGWNKKVQGDLNACKDRQIEKLEDKLKMVREVKDPTSPPTR